MIIFMIFSSFFIGMSNVKAQSPIVVDNDAYVIREGGFLRTQWSQDYPYNQLCPRDPLNNNSYSYAGCPAVAMAQVLNYLQTTQETRFSDSDDYTHQYAGRNYNIDDDYEALEFPSFPELNIMLDSIDATFQRNERLTDLQAAALIFACGTACTQVYTSEGSGTFYVIQAYEAYQRFGFEDCVLFREPDSAMYETLISNLQDGYPAHLAVENPEGTVGHNVVVDGYREEDGKFHINFGYGGSMDGWYDIPDPNFYYGMSKIEGIILNIIPSNTTAVDESFLEQSIEIYPNPADDFIKIKTNKNTEVMIYSVNGQLVMRQNVNEGDATVDVSCLNSGMYFVRVEDAVYKLVVK